MMYFEYSIDMDRLNLQFDVSIGKIINDEIYQESVGSFFNKLVNVFISYINDVKSLYHLYKEKTHITKEMKYLENLCKHKAIAEQVIYMRGYNGKVVDSLLLDEYIQVVKNAITYARLKATDSKLSKYLEQYELQKSGWDTFYKIKIKDIPVAYNKVNDSLSNAITELKISLKDLSSYFERDTNLDIDFRFKTTFKDFIKKIKDAISKDVNIIMMNFEAIQYDIGKKFSKLAENTAEKVVQKNISYKAIKEHSNFVKEITYGTDTYKIYETEYKNVSALNYGGSIIYVENGFFNLPKGYQLATLYHEIGHSQCKHFRPKGFKSNDINKGYNFTIDDTEKIVRQIKKDLNKFLFKVSLSPFSTEERYQNGEEFLYLLLEWEADRFAAGVVGKRLVRKSLAHDMNRILEVPMYKDPKKQADYTKYNIDRTKIRNYVL